MEPVNDLVEVVSGGCLIGHSNLLKIILKNIFGKFYRPSPMDPSKALYYILLFFKYME
jgi:hypothetical protein